jgi:cysteinyl-tRNA synthetase
VLREGTAVLGLFATVAPAAEVPPEILDLVRQRDEARRARDWASSDLLRDRIQAQGYRLEDNPAGTRVRRA